jgi:putative colanic acid biosynthesis acetyltransferase WcaF
MKTNLQHYDNSWYNTGAGTTKRILWYFANVLFIKNTLNPSSAIRVKVLKAFGAKIGHGVNIKPGVNVKYPWNLEIGDYAWIGENVWIDNLGKVTIGANACISQGAMLLCGNHNYKRPTFDLIVGDITLEDGAWVGAQSTVCPGVTIHSHAVLSVSSVASCDLEPYAIYQGIPAAKIRDRKISLE